MRVKGLVAATLVLVMVMGAGVPGAVAAGSFPDVTPELQGVTEVLKELRIITGWEGRFWPDEAFVRQQLAAVVVRLVGLDDEAAANAGLPADVYYIDAPNPDCWSTPYLITAFENHLMRGSRTAAGRVFDPAGSVTFDDTITIVLRALGHETDEMKSDWPQAYRDRALDLGLITPAIYRTAGAAATRGQIASIVGTAVLEVPRADGTYLFPDRVTIEPDPEPGRDPDSGTADETLGVHFIDVGQGDAILLETPNVVILVDGGVRTAGEIVVQYLVDRGIREIDLIIATHPHADHIGGLIEVLRSFKVHHVIDSGVAHTTVTFGDYLTEVERQVAAGHMTYETPQDQVLSWGQLTLAVLGPAPGVDLASLNDNSVVARVDFGDTSFLLTGDAEAAAENHLLQRGVRLQADVLKVGHHGSRTSTTAPFLAAVRPAYAVIQVGEGNRYGHPTADVLERLHRAGALIFRNDLQGTLVFESDGMTLTSTTSPWTYRATPPDTGTDPAPDSPPGGAGVNINTASFEDLQEIIHIGPDRALQIIAMRPFTSLDELTRISGIGSGRLQDIKDQGRAYVE